MRLHVERFLCCLLSASTILQVIALQRDALQPSRDADGAPGDALLLGADDHGFLGSPRPTGCYVHLPASCPKSPAKTSTWWRDVWAVQHGLDEPGCRGRREFWDRYCESEGSAMEYVGQDGAVGQPRLQSDTGTDSGYPSQPGCYVRMPSTCHEPMKANLWRHDTWAEKRGLDRTDCKGRKEFWDRYCEADDSMMEYIEGPGWGNGPQESPSQPNPKADADISEPRAKTSSDIISGYPSQPGCYMRMPSKCPANPMKTSMWRHDTWAEQHQLDGPMCEDRKGYWDSYCAADDTKIVYISQ
mmetsp:Transcript_18503/g.49659  ORF Transcript_18503/g.49659 Transcript_18503/m.49659 type:complete len:300 (-) Transcript_18503:257-1156(-)